MKYDRSKTYTYEGLSFNEHGIMMFGADECKECGEFGWRAEQNQQTGGFYFYWCRTCCAPENEVEQERFRERMLIVAAILSANPQEDEDESGADVANLN